MLALGKADARRDRNADGQTARALLTLHDDMETQFPGGTGRGAILPQLREFC